MRLETILDAAARGWRGPLMAALLAMLAGLPGLIAMPPLDRDESRFAQATAQMLETGDLVTISFQDQPRFKKPVGVHWLQAASVKLLSQVEDRQIWPYRIPSLLGAMLAAAACAWVAAGFFGARAGLLAGILLGGSLLLSTEAGIAKTDAVLCGATTLAMAALGRLYGAAREGPPAGWRSKLLLWLGISLGVLIKGPITPLAVGLTILALAVWDRRGGWLKTLGWSWGLILLAATALPWSAAITVATDGGFWTQAIGGDLAPKLAAGGQEGHAAPPGLHSLLLPLLSFPAAFAIPAAAALAWRGRDRPGVRFAIAWFLPVFLMFEASPTKLVHYPLPAYGGLCLLMAAALTGGIGRRAAWWGAGLAGFAGLIWMIVPVYLAVSYGGAAALAFAILTGLIFAAAAGAGAWLLLKERPIHAAASALALGVLGHAVLLAGVAPSLDQLWLSPRIAKALDAAGLNPRAGAVAAPVAVAGYAEPSLVFALGTETGLGDARDAALAVSNGRPAVVDEVEADAFAAAMAELDLTPRPAGTVSGYNYSKGDAVTLRLYAGEPQPAPLPVR